MGLLFHHHSVTQDRNMYPPGKCSTQFQSKNWSSPDVWAGLKKHRISITGSFNARLQKRGVASQQFRLLDRRQLNYPLRRIAWIYNDARSLYLSVYLANTFSDDSCIFIAAI